MEDDMEEWEKEEMAAMWRFQGACDASAIMHEQERHADSGHGVGGEISHFRNLDSNASKGKVRFIQKFCLKEVERVMDKEEIGAKQAVM